MKIKYGKGYLELPVDVLQNCEILQNIRCSGESQQEIIKYALENPIGSKKLSEIVKKDEKVCIIISDMSRYYQRMDIFLPFIIDELTAAGAKDSDIMILSATGAHADQTEEEHRLLLGEKLADRFTVRDHNCHKEDELVTLGITSYGTPVCINKMAAECDRVILTGAITYHDMAGYGGGRKSVLPGIAAYRSVAANHSRVFDPSPQKGLNPLCKMGNLEKNPMHEDMNEACTMLNPDFMFNIVLDGQGNYYKAVAGHWNEAFVRGTEFCDEAGAVAIEKKADVVIAGAGGYPKDLDLYQTSKAFSAAVEATKDGGTVLIVAQCENSMGTEESVSIITDFQNNYERKKFMTADFAPEAYSGYLLCELAKKYRLLMVTDYQNTDELIKCGIQAFRNLEEGLEELYKGISNSKSLKQEIKTFILPNAMSVLPKQI